MMEKLFCRRYQPVENRSNTSKLRLEEKTEPKDQFARKVLDVVVSLCPTDSFTDTSIGSNRVNGEHKEKILQRWEGGDSNGENYDLDNDAVRLLNTRQCTSGLM